MAQEILVRFVVDDTQLEQTEKEIKKLGGSIEDVKDKTKKAGSDISDSFGDAGKSADNLNGGVLGIIREIKNLAKAAKIGGAAMRSALIATGIGALVVALGLVVAYWDDISEAIGLSNKELETQNNLLGINVDRLDRRLKYLQDEQKYNEENNISNDTNIKKQKELLSLKAIDLQNQIEGLKIEYEKEASLARQQTFWESLLNKPPKITEEEAKNLAERESKILDLQQDLKDTLRLYDEFGAVTIKTPPPPTSGTQEQRADVTSVDAGIEQGIADPYNEQKQKDALRLQALQEGTEEFAIAEQQRIDNEVLGLIKSAEIQNRKTEDEKENAEARIRIAEAEFQAKQMLLDGISGSLDAASELAGRNTAVGKTLAVASALIDTYAAIAGNLKAFAGVPIPGYAIAQSIATGLAGFAAVKNILAVKVPGGGGGGASANFSSSSTPQAPSFNVVGTSGVNQLAQTLGNDETPIRAYVVGGDVTSQQEFDRNVIETSSI